ncbi:MAG: hypothetical protein Q7U20_07790 [Caulobacter sp.]|nr:hypothetical protein [Caulobacter sp.]
MSKLHHLGEALKGGAEIVKELPPLHEHKSPSVAFAAGLMLGALGVALYLRSVKDFAICMAMFLGLSLLIPGVGSAVGWIFAPVYGAWRAYTSNQNGGW